VSMHVSRWTWDKFPLVWIHATESTVKQNLSYVAAKEGDPNKAFQLVSDTLSSVVVNELARVFCGRRPILVSAHAIEGAGVNAIPEVLADVLAQQLDWRIDSGIVQTNIVAHTGANGFSRLARQAMFDGPVVAGDEYILVDDFVGQGGTLTNMRAHILSSGGTVIGATVLTGKPYSAYLQLRADTLEKLRLKHGKALEIWWKQRFGFGFDCLTESEARYLLNTPDAERIRNRIAAAIEA